ncbi:MAG: type II toxin-antitoxin system RelE/ParE family toxin [Eubacteriales bacterium]|nr:type II toxin-antitoxin system RelE/ParE family toxin [Eubacteriales bacterium]
MDYRIIISEDAEADLDEFIRYLLFEKKNEQSARNLLDDFEATLDSLSRVAESLKPCDNPHLKKLGYRRINFLSHRYFMLYRVEENTVFIDNIFHELQDYENRMS